MQTIAFAVPVIAGKKEQLFQLAHLLNNEKRSDFNNFLLRLDTEEENWYLQTAGDHDLCICYLAAKDLGVAFSKLAESKNPFDIWLKQQNKEIFGIDFDEPGQGDMPQVLFEFKVG